MRLPGWLKLEGLLERRFSSGAEREGACQLPDHEIVAQPLAPVFSGLDLIREVVLVKCQIGMRLCRHRDPGLSSDMQRAFILRVESDAYSRLRLLPADSLYALVQVIREHGAAVVPPVQQELRRIHDTGPVTSACRPLPVAVLRPGVRVPPSQVVPVVNVEGERHEAIGGET